MTASPTSDWWIEHRQRLLALADEHLNAFVYHGDTILRAVGRLQRLSSVDRLLFAMKSNFNPDVLRLLAGAGVDFECVSPMEVQHLLASVPGLDKRRVLFTPNFAPREDYARARDMGVQITLDNLYPLQAWPELFTDQRILVRIDPEIGRGHHSHVVTAGAESKFGVPLSEIDDLESLVASAGTEVVGVHAHSGSGIPEAQTWGRVADVLASVADRFPSADILDLGGGLGVPEKPGDATFDLSAMDRALASARDRHPSYSIWLEPGRYLVSQAGVLLTHVTQVKGKGEHRYVGVATGMNALIRPSLYSAYHHIANLSRLDEPAKESATVVGPICETGDTLGRDRLLPTCRENDVIVVTNAGAYGRVMSSQYNMRPIPEEIFI